MQSEMFFLNDPIASYHACCTEVSLRCYWIKLVYDKSFSVDEFKWDRMKSHHGQYIWSNGYYMYTKSEWRQHNWRFFFFFVPLGQFVVAVWTFHALKSLTRSFVSFSIFSLPCTFFRHPMSAKNIWDINDV